MCDDKLAVLASIAARLFSDDNSEIPSALHKALASAGDTLQARYGFVLRFAPDGTAFLRCSWKSADVDMLAEMEFKSSATWWQNRFSKSNPIIFPDVSQLRETGNELAQLSQSLDCDSAVAAAWPDSGVKQGMVLFAAASRDPAWGEKHQGFISSLATILSAAIANADRSQPQEQPRDWHLLHGISRAAGELLATVDIEGSISRALAEFGNAARADRMYVFEDHQDPGSAVVFSTQTYEWTAPGISCELNNPQTHNVPHTGPLRHLFETLERGEAFSYIASKSKRSERSVFDPQSIKSLLNVPIWLDHQLWGFLGVDDCHTERIWSASEIASISAVAYMIGNAVSRLRAEQALITSEERFRMAFDCSPVGVAISDPSMRLLRVNLAYCQMVGYTAEELMRLGVEGITHPEDIAEDRVNFQDVFASKRAVFSHDKRYIHKDGHVVWAHSSASVLRDAQGEPSYIIGQVIDITERKQAEQALRISEERFRHLAEGVADIIWTTDSEGRFTYCTPSVKTILGYTPDEILHQQRHVLFYPDHIEAAEAALQKVLSQRQPYRGLEFRSRHKDGREVVLESSADPVFNRSGAFVGFHGIDRDITIWKQAQAERERLIEELSRAVAEIETLHGLLPICSGCKKIRDEQNNWTAVEQYISQRADINFTHSLCPDCMRKLYPDLFGGAVSHQG